MSPLFGNHMVLQQDVSTDGIANPAAVRYGWKGFPTVNLYNKEGLPAVPFQAK